MPRTRGARPLRTDPSYWEASNECVHCGSDAWSSEWGGKTLVVCDVCEDSGVHVGCHERASGERWSQEEVERPTFVWRCGPSCEAVALGIAAATGRRVRAVEVGAGPSDSQRTVELVRYDERLRGNRSAVEAALAIFHEAFEPLKLNDGRDLITLVCQGFVGEGEGEARGEGGKMESDIGRVGGKHRGRRGESDRDRAGGSNVGSDKTGAKKTGVTDAGGGKAGEGSTRSRGASKHVDPDSDSDDPSSTSPSFDFGNFRVFILRKAGTVIAAAAVRVFGQAFAEIPFIATRQGYRREGACRQLMGSLERFLADLEVAWIILPAATAAARMWRQSFGFSDLADDEADALEGRVVTPDPDSAQFLKKAVERAAAGGSVGTPGSKPQKGTRAWRAAAAAATKRLRKTVRPTADTKDPDFLESGSEAAEEEDDEEDEEDEEAGDTNGRDAEFKREAAELLEAGGSEGDTGGGESAGRRGDAELCRRAGGPETPCKLELRAGASPAEAPAPRPLEALKELEPSSLPELATPSPVRPPLHDSAAPKYRGGRKRRMPPPPDTLCANCGMAEATRFVWLEAGSAAGEASAGAAVGAPEESRASGTLAGSEGGRGAGLAAPEGASCSPGASEGANLPPTALESATGPPGAAGGAAGPPGASKGATGPSDAPDGGRWECRACANYRQQHAGAPRPSRLFSRRCLKSGKEGPGGGRAPVPAAAAGRGTPCSEAAAAAQRRRERDAVKAAASQRRALRARVLSALRGALAGREERRAEALARADAVAVAFARSLAEWIFERQPSSSPSGLQQPPSQPTGPEH